MFFPRLERRQGQINRQYRNEHPLPAWRYFQKFILAGLNFVYRRVGFFIMPG